MAILVTKDIPTSSFYTGGGTTETITLNGVTEISGNVKNSLLKITRPQSKATWTANPEDNGINYVVDLKRIEDTIQIKGWLEDDSTETAWNKLWKIRAMSIVGGPLTSLVIENLTFPLGTPGSYTIPQAFLESITYSLKLTYEQTINTNSSVGARIEVTLSFYIGNQR